jgi:hypothetical protein
MRARKPVSPNITATCHCKSVAVVAFGSPITAAACYCDSCQEASRQISALTNAPCVAGSDGGTEYVLYRKDRVLCTQGKELLKAYKLDPASPTSRVVATCCNTAILLTFDDNKHWVDLYRSRCLGNVPALRMRVCTRFAPDAERLPLDVPQFPSYPLRFIAALIWAKFGMWFNPARGV